MLNVEALDKYPNRNESGLGRRAGRVWISNWGRVASGGARTRWGKPRLLRREERETDTVAPSLRVCVCVCERGRGETPRSAVPSGLVTRVGLGRSCLTRRAGTGGEWGWVGQVDPGAKPGEAAGAGAARRAGAASASAAAAG